MKKEENVETNIETPIEETVKIRLLKTREKQDDVFVSVNGRNFKLQRGVEIEVPKVVAEVLENSQRMDELALERQQNLSQQSL